MSEVTEERLAELAEFARCDCITENDLEELVAALRQAWTERDAARKTVNGMVDKLWGINDLLNYTYADPVQWACLARDMYAERVSERDTLKAEVEQLRHLMDNDEVGEELKWLRAEVDRLKPVVKHYADHDNWDNAGIGRANIYIYDYAGINGYELAEAALRGEPCQ